MMIFRKAKNGELKENSGLQQLCDQVMEIDVSEAGVKGAKSFFEQQVAQNSSFLFVLFFSKLCPLFNVLSILAGFEGSQAAVFEQLRKRN